MPASNCIGIKHLFVLYWLSTALGYFIYGMNDEENVVDNVIQTRQSLNLQSKLYIHSLGLEIRFLCESLFYDKDIPEKKMKMKKKKGKRERKRQG